MAFEKTNFDKKTFFTLIAFIAVGILLFFLLLARPNKQVTPGSGKPENNAPAFEGSYYGKEAIEMAGTVYDANGNVIDMSTLTEATDLYDKNGKLLNLPTISPEEYASLKGGISYEELCEIVGGEASSIKGVDDPEDEYYTASYLFYGDKAESSAKFLFQGNRLKSMGNTNLVQEK